MKYISTRSQDAFASCAQAVALGISPDGGLFVPDSFPRISIEDIRAMADIPYHKRAKRVMAGFFNDFTESELDFCCEGAYSGEGFDTPVIAPVSKVGEAYMLELYHGPTQAFKDMALRFLPRALPVSLEKTGAGKRCAVLVATSGDTGKAALEGFSGVEGTSVIVFYPQDGVSPAQKLQMITQKGSNTFVAAVNGNFDDAQTGVKLLFGDSSFQSRVSEAGYALSSANSINWGRLAPQIAYYFSAYADMLKSGLQLGETINICVPTGNFGNILAAYYAMKMGLPVNRLICASNRNNVLTEWISTGVYDAGRPFYRTTSPSMDILVSSNAERLVFELCGRDGGAVSRLMRDLAEKRAYKLPGGAAMALRDRFWGAWASDERAGDVIRRTFNDCGRLIDTHPAVAFAALEDYSAETGDAAPALVVSTASPYKFAGSVLEAIAGKRPDDEFEAADMLEKLSDEPIPKPLKEIRALPVLHNTHCEKSGMGDAVLGFLSGGRNG